MNTKLRINCLLLGAALLAAACGGLKIPGVSGTTTSPAATSSGPAEASGDPREDLKKAFTAQLAAKSYRYRLEFSLAGGGHANAEFAAPDRYHITVLRQLPVPGREIRQEIIIIGKDTFMKIGSMPWQKTETDSAETTQATTLADLARQFREEDVAQRMKKYEDVKFVGHDVVDGSPALVYRFILKETQGQTPGKIWVGANDGLPHKIEHENRLTVTYYDYNANINIEPPV